MKPLLTRTSFKNKLISKKTLRFARIFRSSELEKKSEDITGESEESQIRYFTNMQWNIKLDDRRKIIYYNYKIISEQPINQ